jgi:hypothetical protein
MFQLPRQKWLRPEQFIHPHIGGSGQQHTSPQRQADQAANDDGEEAQQFNHGTNLSSVTRCGRRLESDAELVLPPVPQQGKTTTGLNGPRNGTRMGAGRTINV